MFELAKTTNAGCGLTFIKLISKYEHIFLFFVILVQEVNKMDKKCTKYEGLFIFSDDATLNEHLETCEDCRAEQEKMDKVSDLLSEVKFYYRAKNKKKQMLKVACLFMFIIFFTGTFGIIATNDDIQDSLMYGQELSAEDLGFPVDSYGLLMVDD